MNLVQDVLENKYVYNLLAVFVCVLLIQLVAINL